MNKREFMLTGGGACAALAIPVWAAAAARPIEVWQSSIGSSFDVAGPLGRTTLRLSRVVLHSSDSRLAQFTLVFERQGAELPAGMHQLKSVDGDVAPLFLDDAGDVLMRADCAVIA